MPWAKWSRCSRRAEPKQRCTSSRWQPHFHVLVLGRCNVDVDPELGADFISRIAWPWPRALVHIPPHNRVGYPCDLCHLFQRQSIHPLPLQNSSPQPIYWRGFCRLEFLFHCWHLYLPFLSHFLYTDRCKICVGKSPHFWDKISLPTHKINIDNLVT